ncbi:MAG: hypothetical protein WC637_00870 [Victivallales bacterium]|jgi:hypothetical protein
MSARGVFDEFLRLPEYAVPDRAEIVRGIPPYTRQTVLNLDGQGEFPAYIRGVGGEDTFGLGYGGNQTVPLTHHNASMP